MRDLKISHILSFLSLLCCILVTRHCIDQCCHLISWLGNSGNHEPVSDVPEKKLPPRRCGCNRLENVNRGDNDPAGVVHWIKIAFSVLEILPAQCTLGSSGSREPVRRFLHPPLIPSYNFTCPDCITDTSFVR